MRQLFKLFVFKLFLISGLPLMGQQGHLDQQQDEKLLKDQALIGLPVIFYLPETKLGFGGVGRFSFKWRQQQLTEKISSISIGLVYTLNKQFLAYLPYNLYFKEDKFWLKGELGYYDYFYPYFGIGNDQRIEMESYTVNFPRLQSDFLYKVKGELYLGFNYRFDKFSNLEFEEEGVLVLGETLGTDGGNISGIGPSIIIDKRDHINFPSKGYLLELKSFHAEDFLGSDYHFSFLEYSLSKYFPKGKNVLALNLYGKSVWGEIPFYEYALFGGGKQARGYLQGSFRDSNALGLQAEYRFVFKKRFGATLFANVGSVFKDLKDLNFENALPAMGAGFRYALSAEEKVNLRLDLGIGKEGLQFYFTFGEAF